MPTRHASATWEGGLKGGKGSYKTESGAAAGGYGFGSRFESAGGSNPEELLAAAHAACYSMALSAGLEKAGTPATKVETQAGCTIEKGEAGFKITGIKLTVRAQVPGATPEGFAAVAQATKTGCPVSGALSAVPIELDAALG